MAGARLGAVLRDLRTLFGTGTIGGLADAQLLERFAAGRDEAAFAALVARHGAMVLAVCRGVLRCPHDAEDAFQATFLVLARKAGSLRVGDSLGGWLHRVAHRVAVQANIAAARRQARERRGAILPPARAPADGTWDDVVPALHEEIGRLPEKYRAPVVLCDLEGLTREQAAGQLGWPPGTVAGRLARGRDLLRARLVRRGMAPAGGIAGALLAARDASATVPPAWAEAAVGAAGHVAAGHKIAAGAISAAALTLTEGVMTLMRRAEVGRVGLGFTALIAVAAALAAAFATAAREEPKPARTVVGKVVDEGGRPIAGAEVRLPIHLKFEDQEAAPVLSDAEGRFALPIREEWLGLAGYARDGIVWANAPGHSLGVAQASKAIWGEDRSEITIRLGPATDTAFAVVGPDGLPVVGARVEPYYVKTPRAYEFPPKGMLPAVGATTDALGIARLPAVERRGLSTVLTEAEALGKQTLRLRDGANEPPQRTIRLRPVGRIEGRVVAEKPGPASGIDLYFTTEERGPDVTNSLTQGEAHVVTDDRGRFSVAAMASGELKIEGRVDRSLPLRLRLPDGSLVRSGDTTRLEIPLGPAVKVRGIVRSAETKQPLADATISVGYGTWRQNDTVTTGPDGRYEAYVVPGNVTLHVISGPAGYLQLGAPWAQPVRVAGPGEFDLPPIELVKEGPEIAGKLVDGQDRPLAKVRVIGANGNRRFGFATTDPQGAFRMRGVPAGITLDYTAWTEEESAVPTEILSANPLVLRVRFKGERAEQAGAGDTVSARVVDPGGEPVVGVELILYENQVGPDGQYVSGQYDRFGATDARGWIRKPHPVAKGNEYRVIVQPGSVAVAGSETIKADGRNPVEFRPLVVERLGTIEGRVVDAGGRPVAGATVRNWGNAAPLTASSSGDDGSFRLSGVPPGEIFLFAEAPGYRFHGGRVDPANRPVRLVLHRRDAPPERTLTRLGPAIPRAEAAGLARKLITPYADRALAGSDREASARALEVLALIDPDGAWAKIQAGDKTWDRDAAKLGVFRAFRDESPDDARAVLPLIKTPFWRLYSATELIDSLPDDQAARKKGLLAEALAEARKLDDPGEKFHAMARYARRLADLGETASARRVVEEIAPLAKPLDAGDGQREATQALAAALGRIDAKAAVALIPEDGEERTRNDIRGTVAEAIAAIDPAEAERLIGQYTHDSSEVFKVHACARMAPVDLSRARRMAAAIKSDGLRGYAFGLMADALGAANRGPAGELLDESRRAFADAATRGLGGLWQAESAAVMAASLLPVVGRVAPDRLDESLWRAASLRWSPRTLNDLTRTIPDASRYNAMEQGAGLALMLARYDRDLARTILSPVVDRLLALPAGEDVRRLEWRLILRVLAQVDPRRAAETALTIPDLKEGSDGRIHDAAPHEVAKALAEDLEQVLADSRMRMTDLEILLRESR